MKDLVKIMNDERLLEINHISTTAPFIVCEFGDKINNHLVIKIDRIFGTIISIICYEHNNLIEDSLNLPEPSEFDVGIGVSYFPKKDLENCGDFQLIFNEKELDIIIDQSEEIFECYKEERVEYYINENNSLAYIRIRNLTPEEYSILQSQKKNFSR